MLRNLVTEKFFKNFFLIVLEHIIGNRSNSTRELANQHALFLSLNELK